MINLVLNAIKIVRLVILQQKMIAYLVKMDFYILKPSKNVMSILAIVENLFPLHFLV